MPRLLVPTAAVFQKLLALLMRCLIRSRSSPLRRK
ncbi:hypothetical protein KPSA1_01373 [Pseudomonas syringae pv. actinidiae]|uniref:Uncharacterized protein n=1 Tax=Pseudomonas syringae pv. actinidiae TaxID=103796 RepID=A0A2V0Q6Z3_PSESF|nr:hypothetical protein KPSA1_01373 [Pseudomonas syringae pv. actinidiae]